MKKSSNKNTNRIAKFASVCVCACVCLHVHVSSGRCSRYSHCCAFFNKYNVLRGVKKHNRRGLPDLFV